MSQENKDQLAPELELKPIEIKEKKDDGIFQEVDLSCKTQEKEIVLQVVVETLRLATNGIFFAVILLGIFLTTVWGGIPADNLIENTFGNRQICLYFDFRPIPYVVPPLYCLCVLFMILYSAANTFRAWIAYEEKKISKPFRLFCQICYVNLAIAGLLFSLCFAVQPHDHESLIVHTGPFAYFTIALVMNQIAVVLFGREVSWKKETGSYMMPQWFLITSYIHVVLQAIVTLIKCLVQMNGLLEWSGHGLVFHPKIQNNFVVFTTVIDWSWFLTGFFFPIVQSAYFVYKGKQQKTHDLIIKISDNRKASTVTNDTQVSTA